MSTYRKPNGDEVLVCDTCGCGEDGTRPDLTGANKFDLNAELAAQGFPFGTTIEVRDTCPACTKKGKPS